MHRGEGQDNFLNPPKTLEGYRTGGNERANERKATRMSSEGLEGDGGTGRKGKERRQDRRHDGEDGRVFPKYLTCKVRHGR